jgi:hypothetical protein
MSDYKTREDLKEENEGLRESLGKILDETQKEDPDVDFIEDEASSALDLDEEDDDEDDDDIEDSDEDEDDDEDEEDED